MTPHTCTNLPSCFGCKIKTLQLQSGPVFQPHYNYSVGSYVNTKQDYVDALNRCADRNSEVTGTLHSYEPRYPGDNEPIRSADQVLDDRNRNIRALHD
jgi:hypothetical protein